MARAKGNTKAVTKPVTKVEEEVLEDDEILMDEDELLEDETESIEEFVGQDQKVTEDEQTPDLDNENAADWDNITLELIKVCTDCSIDNFHTKQIAMSLRARLNSGERSPELYEEVRRLLS